MTPVDIFLMMMIFQVKHFLADYILQFEFMYKKKGAAEGWFMPLFAHAAIHGVITAYIVYFFAPSVAFFALVFDVLTHMVIDRWKATRSAGIEESKFWYYLGADQALHHMVGIFIIFLAFGSS